MSPMQKDFSEWINKTSMTAFGGFVLQCLWVVGSLSLTYVACKNLLTDPSDYFKNTPMALGAGKAEEVLARMTLYTAMANSYVTQAHNTGQNIAFALLAAWGVGKGINAVQHGKDRDTSHEKIEAEANAQATLNESAARITKDRAALVNVENADKVEARPRA